MFDVVLYKMLSGNPIRLYLLVTLHPHTLLFPQKSISNLLGKILLLRTNAEKGLLLAYILLRKSTI